MLSRSTDIKSPVSTRFPGNKVQGPHKYRALFDRFFAVLYHKMNKYTVLLRPLRHHNAADHLTLQKALKNAAVII